MKKIIITVLALILAFGIFLLIRRIEWIAVFPPKGFSLPRPSIWVSDNPQLYVYHEVNAFLGKMYDDDSGEYIEIWMSISYDIQRISIRLPISGEREHPRLFRGTPQNINNDTFILTVTHSYVSYVEVGDVITFYQLDELPEWAMA
jgi:hypothetical protein